MNEGKKYFLLFLAGLVLGSLFAGLAFKGYYTGRELGQAGEFSIRLAEVQRDFEERNGALAADTQRLQEHNDRAGELVKSTAERLGGDAKNLQDAIRLLGEVKKQVRLLENLYDNRGSDSSSGGNGAGILLGEEITK
jgi:hypothetical protein